MKVVVSSISDSLAANYTDFENAFGFGPCGAYAALKREQGWGKVAVCTASDGKVEFTHYVIITTDGIVDLANPLDCELTYTDLDILNDDEMPELCDDREAIDWLAEREI